MFVEVLVCAKFDNDGVLSRLVSGLHGRERVSRESRVAGLL